MISAATQSTVKTIAGQRYLLAIHNGSSQGVGPSTTFTLVWGSGYSQFAPDNTSDPVFWGAGEVKYLTFTAWGDGIKLNTTSADVLWKLIPLSS
jgi:hypothetical protein